jgi:hypothetical protein
VKERNENDARKSRSIRFMLATNLHQLISPM